MVFALRTVDLKVIAEGRVKRLMAIKEMNIIAECVDGRVVVWDPKLGSQLFTAGFFGKPVGIRKPKGTFFEEPLELSLYEALYLAEKGVIKIRDASGQILSVDDLRRIGNKTYQDFDAKYKVYKDLRDRGYIVRPGMKFGSDFSVYRYGPGIDHAPFLVTVYSKDTRLLGIDFVRAGRLANSVRKKWVIATILEGGTIRYFVFSWFRL